MPNSQRITIPKIASTPAAFAEPFAKVNAAFRVLQAIANMKGTGGITIVKTGDNWIIDASNVTGGTGVSGRFFTASFTPDTEQVVPEDTDLVTAIASVYSGATTPAEGDTILLTYSTAAKFEARVTATDLTAYATGLFCLELGTYAGTTWFATVKQLGLY